MKEHSLDDDTITEDLENKLINFQNNCPLLLAIIGMILIIASLMVLTGWIFHIPALTRVLNSWITMKVNTSLCFVLSGLALLLSAIKNQGVSGVFKLL